MTRVGVSMTLLVILCSLNQAASEVYYINSSDHCSVQPCLTLSQFAANLSHYLQSNTTLVFLPGTHYLNRASLILSHVEEFTMKSETTIAEIECANDSSMHFSQSKSIHLTNLNFVGCGDNKVKHVEDLLVNGTKFEGQESGGTALDLIGTTAKILNSTFVSNSGSYREYAIVEPSNGPIPGIIGGAIIATNNTNITIGQSWFEDNGADYGGAIFADNSIIQMTHNVSFVSNTVTYDGGVLYSNGSVITTINASTFSKNFANAGGVLSYFNSTVTVIEFSEFRENVAYIGGALASFNSIITVRASEFDGNSASYGGVLHSSTSTITVGDCNFTNNSSPEGAVIYAMEGTKLWYHNHLWIDSNSAENYAVIYLTDSEFRGCDSGNLTFSNNLGSIVAFNSNITFSIYAVFVNNLPSKVATDDPLKLEEGGAITLFQSTTVFDGVCILEYNHAENGGAIHSTESKLYVNGDVTMAHNTATGNGGGTYLSNSELNCQPKSTFVLHNNTAASKGGGLHVISSSIKAASKTEDIGRHNNTESYRYVGARINFTSNEAKFGGGLSLEANAKLDILKYDAVLTSGYYENDINTAIFTGNSADYGGAVYLDDDTISGTCSSDPKTECFFQMLGLYDFNPYMLAVQSMYFSQNIANFSGSTLYGGLLDRCALSPFAEIYKKYTIGTIGGIGYFKNVSLAQQVIQYHLIPFKFVFAPTTLISVTARVVRSMLKKVKPSQYHLWLSIRLVIQLVQSSGPPSTSRTVV